MSDWKGKSRGGYFGHLFFIIILKYLNSTIAYFVLRFVAAYFLLFSATSVKSLFFLYHKILGFGRVKSILTIYRNFYTFGQILLDKVSLFSGFDKKIGYVSEGTEQIQKLVDMDCGGLLITTHFGGWELSGQLMDNIGNNCVE